MDAEEGVLAPAPERTSLRRDGAISGVLVPTSAFGIGVPVVHLPTDTAPAVIAG